MKPLPTQERLHQLLDYNKSTGVFIWKVKVAQRCPAGSLAGTKSGRYLCASIDKRIYSLHRVAWRYVTGDDPAEMFIDHIDGNGLNNAFSNLRLASREGNTQNCKTPSTNKTGFKGVYFNKSSGNYRSCIRAQGKTLNLGSFKTPEEAHAAYCAAAKVYYGEFFRSS